MGSTSLLVDDGGQNIYWGDFEKRSVTMPSEESDAHTVVGLLLLSWFRAVEEA